MDEDCNYYNLPEKIEACGPVSAFLLRQKAEGFFDDRPAIACTTFVTSMSDEMLSEIEQVYLNEDEYKEDPKMTDIIHSLMLLLAIKSGEMKGFVVDVNEVCLWRGVLIVGVAMEMLRREGKVTPESMDVPLDQMRNSNPKKY